MKAQKITRIITTETFHEDSIPALLAEAQVLMETETRQGQLVKEDGDTISWHTEIKVVEI